MEEEKGLGNIIFYIIAAVIAIVSSLKKKKQPAGAGDYRPAEERPGGFPDDMFDDDIEEAGFPAEYKPEPVTTARQNPVMSAKKVYVPVEEGMHDEPMASTYAREGVSALDHIETARRFEEMVKEAAVKVYDLKEADLYDYDNPEVEPESPWEDFEASKAVVWAEIINRKEY
jgi:hypothetical protein